MLLLEPERRGHETTPRCRSAAAIGTHTELRRHPNRQTPARPLLLSSSFTYFGGEGEGVLVLMLVDPSLGFLHSTWMGWTEEVLSPYLLCHLVVCWSGRVASALV